MAKPKITISFLFFFIFLVLTNFLLVSTTLTSELVLNSITLSDIDSGSTEYTNSQLVNLVIDCSGSPKEMMFSHYEDFRGESWFPYKNPIKFEFGIPPYTSIETLYCKLRDASLQESNIASGTIYLDTIRPAIYESYTRILDTTTIEICFGEPVIGGDVPSNYTVTNGITVLSVKSLPSSPRHTYPHSYILTTTPHIRGHQYTLTVSKDIQDLAGNYIDPNSRTYTYTAPSTLDNIPPRVESFEIEGGASYINTRDVNISMTECDEGGIAVKWLIKENSTPPPGTDFILTERPTTFTLSEREGIKFLYVWVMDDSGNISSSKVARIYLDQTPPIANAGQDQIVALGNSVTLDGSLSKDNYEISQYIWDFGDSSPDEEGIAVTHRYTSPGVYMATLSIYDAAGNGPLTDNVTVTVKEPDIGVGGPNPDCDTISDAMAMAEDGMTIYVYPDTYCEDVYLKEGVILRGDNNVTTIIDGNIVCKDSDSSIENLTITSIITATNSEIIVKNCIITGGIEIWNLEGSDDISPRIENNLIKNTGYGIYYFSQASGGAILGQIKNNTFYHNTNGIVLRMHKEKPEIKNNIITDSKDAIHLTYCSLLPERLVSITNNCFFNNTNNVWCDELQREQFILRRHGERGWDPGIIGNIFEDPLFADPSNDDFSLDINSLCKEKADDGSDMGAQQLVPRPSTADDVIAKVVANDRLIKDAMADVTMTSNAPWFPPTMQLKLWEKGDKQKVQEISPEPGVYIRPSADGGSMVNMVKTIISYDSTINIYVIKSIQESQTEEYPYQIDYIDYNKGVVTKSERYIKDGDYIAHFITEYSDFVNINGIWGFQTMAETAYDNAGNQLYGITSSYSNIQFNTGIPDSAF
jgi:parallel beta-helix repeat protein